MRIVINETVEQAVEFCADQFCRQLTEKPDSVLGLATGGTPQGLYQRLITLQHSGELSFKQAVSFNLDEYLGLAPTHPQSYRHYMQRELFDHIDIDPANTHLPGDGCSDDLLAGEAYEQRIEQAGGIDLQLLGIGANGHIGFNEPSSSLCSRTRVKTLTPKTLSDNRRFFADGESQPHLALTMGIGSILDSRAVLLLATGEGKAAAIAAAIEGPLSAICPASALQQHNHATLVLDSAAARALKLQDYYQFVERERQQFFEQRR